MSKPNQADDLRSVTLRGVHDRAEAEALALLEAEPWPQGLEPLSPALERRLLALLPGAPAPAPRLRWWTRGWRWLSAPSGVFLPAAALGLLGLVVVGAPAYLSRGGSALMAYEAEVSGGEEHLGAAPAVPPRDVVRVFADARLRILLRPHGSVAEGELRTQAWIHDANAAWRPWPVALAAQPSGQFGLDHRVQELPGLTPGMHDLAFVVGRARHFPGEAEIRKHLDELPGDTSFSARDFRILRRRVSVEPPER